MKLTGQVTLDEETMAKLRDTIRAEVVEEIKNEGNYTSEIVKYLLDCGYVGYIEIIRNTIDEIISKIGDKDIIFDSDQKAYQQILAIQSILKIQ